MRKCWFLWFLTLLNVWDFFKLKTEDKNNKYDPISFYYSIYPKKMFSIFNFTRHHYIMN